VVYHPVNSLSRKKCMSTAKKVMYVDNKKFYNAILEHKQKVKEAKEKGLDEPRIPDYIGECIYKIAERLSTKPCFVSYSYRDEMVSDGIENSILYFNDYDPNIGSNPFAYFTQVIYFAFIRRINKEEKNRYTMYKNFYEMISYDRDSSNLVDHDDNHVLPVQLYDNINEFMEKFERKEKQKKEKRKTSKEGLLKFYEE
jgi:hypothetical protein